jgi:hypothetical protein
MTLPERLLNAYRQTSYIADNVSVRVAQRSPAMDALLIAQGARAGAFVTAWNPLSHRMPPEWNRRMQQRLKQRLRRYSTVAAEGSWRRWREEHLLLFADPRVALKLARQFRQVAIVVVQRGQPAALITSFPVFSPRNSIPSAVGAFSSPSTMWSFCCRRPPRICAESHARASK